MSKNSRSRDPGLPGTNLAAAYQKQKTKGSDIVEVANAEHQVAKQKKKWSKRSAKKAHLASSASLPCSSDAEWSDSYSNGNTECC